MQLRNTNNMLFCRKKSLSPLQTKQHTKRKPRVLVVVSNDKSDLYFANCLIQSANVVAVVVENQIEAKTVEFHIQKIIRLLKTPTVLIRKIPGKIVHAYRRKFAIYHQDAYKTDFGEYGYRLFTKPGCEVLHTQGVNDINEFENVEWIEEQNPDLIAVCGASIFKHKLLSIPLHGVLNLHGGLSQKYRGLFTTDWAIYNNEPEYIGATVHFMSSGIDDGDVIYQGRPTIEEADNPNSLYVKVVKLGVKMMLQAIKDIENNSVHTVPLKTKGKLYLGDYYGPHYLNKTWKYYQQGLIRNYCRNKLQRDKAVIKKLLVPFKATD